MVPPSVAVVSVTEANVGVSTVGATVLLAIFRVAVDWGSGILSVRIVLVILSTVKKIVLPTAEEFSVTR